jgi:DNA-binding MarR family transcriptional regulator
VAGDSDEDGLSEVFWAVARRLRRLGRETVEPWDITPAQSRALGVLQHHGVMRLSELSDHLRIAPRSTTEFVDGLQERGLVERRGDPSDRRAILVTLTEQGQKVGTAIQTARKAEAERFFGELSPEDREELHRILRTLRG